MSGRHAERTPGPRVPDVFIVGTSRAGTSWMHVALRGHPGIFMALQKELCHACPEIASDLPRYRRTFVRDRDAYLAHFRDARPDQLVGESCVLTVHGRNAADRLRSINPDARAIIHLRDPVERIRSLHALRLALAHPLAPSLEQALADDAAWRRTRTTVPDPVSDRGLRDMVLLADPLERLILGLGRDRVHVTIFEDLREDPVAAWAATVRWLGLEPVGRPDTTAVMATRPVRSIRFQRLVADARLVGAAKRVVPTRLHEQARRVALAGFRLNSTLPSIAPTVSDADLVASLRAEFREDVERQGALVGRDLVARWWGERAEPDGGGTVSPSSAPAGR